MLEGTSSMEKEYYEKEAFFETMRKETEEKLKLAEVEIQRQRDIMLREVEVEKEAWNREKVLAKKFEFDEIIELSVGGALFTTRLSTLTTGVAKDSMLAAMFSGRHEVSKDRNGIYFIDRDGTHFGIILNFLRDPNRKLPIVGIPTISDIYHEAMYYGLDELVNALLQLEFYVPIEGLTTTSSFGSGHTQTRRVLFSTLTSGLAKGSKLAEMFLTNNLVEKTVGFYMIEQCDVEMLETYLLSGWAELLAQGGVSWIQFSKFPQRALVPVDMARFFAMLDRLEIEQDEDLKKFRSNLDSLNVDGHMQRSSN